MKTQGQINTNNGTYKVENVKIEHVANNNYQMIIETNECDVTITISEFDARDFFGSKKNEIVEKHLTSDEVINQIDAFVNAEIDSLV